MKKIAFVIIRGHSYIADIQISEIAYCYCNGHAMGVEN